MKVDMENGLPESLLSRLDPGRVQEYVRALGWRHEPQLGKGKLGVYERPESRLAQVSVPLTNELSDFVPVMERAVSSIAAWEKRPPVEVLHDLLLPPADVLRFRESGPVAGGGNVPLEHGITLLAGARKALLAAACSVRRPATFHPRMSLTDAELFLRQCRLGQTEVGSFVVTVACPLEVVPASETLFDPPFGRQVTALLMRSLHRLAHALEIGDPESALKEVAGEPVLSANLCEGLLDMMPEGDDSSLTISASWERSRRDNSGPLPEVVRLRREAFPRIEAIATRLRPAQAPRRQTFVGFVDTLDGRPNPDGQREGPVVLRVCLPEGDSIRARADLNVADHHTAWEAYEQDRPVRLQGVLRRLGRIHRIDDVAGFRVVEDDGPG